MYTTRRARHPAGFTLIEIMVVIAIIGLLATLVAPNVMNKWRMAQVTTTRTKIEGMIKPAIDQYRLTHHKLPDTLEVLLEPDEKALGDAYLEPDNLKDAWGFPFQYFKKSNSKYDIVSLGADGIEGGENDDADIHSDKSDMPGG